MKFIISGQYEEKLKKLWKRLYIGSCEEYEAIFEEGEESHGRRIEASGYNGFA